MAPTHTPMGMRLCAGQRAGCKLPKGGGEKKKNCQNSTRTRVDSRTRGPAMEAAPVAPVAGAAGGRTLPPFMIDAEGASALKEEASALYKKADYKGAVEKYSAGLEKLGRSEAQLRGLEGENLSLLVAPYCCATSFPPPPCSPSPLNLLPLALTPPPCISLSLLPPPAQRCQPVRQPRRGFAYGEAVLLCLR
jgi:hypothetical protein